MRVAAATFVAFTAVTFPAAAQTTSPSAIAPAQSVAPSPPHGSAPPAPGGARAPFGAGTPVEITASEVVDVYVARGSSEQQNISDFIKLGKTPLAFQLPPGLYTIEVESPSVTTGERIVTVGEQPKQLVARTGKNELATIGTMSLALGITALLTGVVTFAAFSGQPDADNREKTIALPLLIGGGVFSAGGLGMFLASRTSVEDATPSDTIRTADAGVRPRGIVSGLRLSF